MDLKEKEREILNLYADNVDLFVNCEHLVFDDLWSTKFNQVKYKIIKHNHGQGKKSDTYLLSNQLIKSGCNKKEIGLEVSEPNYKIAKNVDEYVKDIFDEYSKRQLTPLLQRVHSELTSELGDVAECLEDLKTAINEIELIKNNLSTEKTIHDIFDEMYEEFINAQNNKKEVIGYATGLRDLDKITCGLKQEVIVIGATPGAGKSSLVVTIAVNVSVIGDEPMIIFSLEMPRTELLKNIAANVLKINSWKIRSGNADEEEELKVKNFKNKLKTNLIVDDTPAITWQYMETKIRKLRKTIPLSKTIVVMIDYLQLMNNTKDEYVGMNDERQLAIRCKSLQQLHKKYNLCLIELSQVSRKCADEKRPPRLPDLLGSGAIEQNAVQCWLMHRPDYYLPNPVDEKGMDLKGLCEINIAKNRYGQTKPIYVKFKGSESAFEDYRPNSDGISNSNESDDVF